MSSLQFGFRLTRKRIGCQEFLNDLLKPGYINQQIAILKKRAKAANKKKDAGKQRCASHKIAKASCSQRPGQGKVLGALRVQNRHSIDHSLSTSFNLPKPEHGTVKAAKRSLMVSASCCTRRPEKPLDQSSVH